MQRKTWAMSGNPNQLNQENFNKKQKQHTPRQNQHPKDHQGDSFGRNDSLSKYQQYQRQKRRFKQFASMDARNTFESPQTYGMSPAQINEYKGQHYRAPYSKHKQYNPQKGVFVDLQKVYKKYHGEEESPRLSRIKYNAPHLQSFKSEQLSERKISPSNLYSNI